MLLDIKITKRRILKLIQFIPWQDFLIKKIEFIRGLYRYPSKMVGRKLTFYHNKMKTDVLVFAAHTDDDVLGLGTTLYRHCLKGDHIKIVFVTNGSADWSGVGQSWNLKAHESKRRSETRFTEAIKSLSLLNIPKENIFCLGYPDGGTQRYLKNMSDDIHMLFQKFNPGMVYVHCIEGGHIDHDMTSFVVKSVCHTIGYTNVFEWAEYNPKQPIGSTDIKFLPTQSNENKIITIDITEEERILKRRMLSFHVSQNVERFYSQGEAIRKANLTELDMELYEHCQIPKVRLIPIVKKFYSMMELKTKKVFKASGEKRTI